MDVTPYMGSYMASNGCCFMVYRMFRQAHLKEVDLTQKQETMTVQSRNPQYFIAFLCRKAHMDRMVMK